MNNPKVYTENNRRQRIDNIRCLNENIFKMKWKGKDKILDVGSGDGRFTVHLLDRLPENVEVVGIDRSPEMVHHAKEKYADKRVDFKVLDISKDLPKEFLGHFDHVFSFYSLHWVFDQQKAFTNIFKLLADDGDCLLSILGDIPAFFDVNYIFARSEKWRVWVRDLKNVVSPYHGCLDPEPRVRLLMKSTGFKDVDVKCQKHEYTYASIDDFKNSVKAVTAFKIPSEMFEEYLEEYAHIAIKEGFIDQDLKIVYSLITVFGKKYIKS